MFQANCYICYMLYKCAVVVTAALWFLFYRAQLHQIRNRNRKSKRKCIAKQNKNKNKHTRFSFDAFSHTLRTTHMALSKSRRTLSKVFSKALKLCQLKAQIHTHTHTRINIKSNVKQSSRRRTEEQLSEADKNSGENR